MFLPFLIAFFSIVFLLVLHELGHFVLAKKFGVKVEEFGLFYPPRIFGKKIGETIYSLNILPFGALVKIYGERNTKDPQAFGAKPIWQRALIVLGGVLSFWLIAAFLFSMVMPLGFTEAVTDEADKGLLNPQVQIIGVAPGSPAEGAGLKVGDTIIKIKNQKSKIKNVDKIGQVTEFTQAHLGEEIFLTIQRGKEVLEVSLVPRISPPEDEGAMGVALVRVAQKKYSLSKAPLRGIQVTFDTTYFALKGWLMALKRLFAGLPTGVQLAGPVGAFSILSEAASYNAAYFLQVIATLSIYIALFNVLPIPLVDGGRLLFLLIEKLRGRMISEKVEARINSIFLFLLMVLMITITIKDIRTYLR